MGSSSWACVSSTGIEISRTYRPGIALPCNGWLSMSGDEFTIMVLAFAAGMVTHRFLWTFFDWVLDKLEDMDERY